MLHVRSFLVFGLVCVVIGVLTQPNTWFQLSQLGVPYPRPLVTFLDSPSVGAAMAFAGGAIARRVRGAVVAGPAMILASFAGYYGAYDWAGGLVSGAPQWVFLALLSGPVAGLLGHWWWRRGVRWLVAAPMAFVGSDQLTIALDRSPHLDGSQFADVAFAMCVVAVAAPLVATGGLRDRVRLVLVTALLVPAVSFGMAFVVVPVLELIHGLASAPVVPDVTGDGS